MPQENGTAPETVESDDLSPDDLATIERLSGPAPKAPEEAPEAPQAPPGEPQAPQLGPDGQPLPAPEAPQAPPKKAYRINGKQVEMTDSEVQAELNRIHLGKRAEEKLHSAKQLEQVLNAREESLRSVVEEMLERPMETLFDAFVGRYDDYGQAEEALLGKVREWIRPHIQASGWPEDRRKSWNEERRRSWELARKEREIQAREAEIQARTTQGKQAEDEQRTAEFNQKVIERLAAVGIPNNWLMASIYNECKQRYEAAGVKWTPLLAAEVVKRHWHKAGDLLKPSNPAVDALRRASQSPGQGYEATPQASQPPGKKRRASMQQVFGV